MTRLRSLLPTPSLWMFLLSAAVASGGCDCENRIRQALSNRNRAERQPVTSTSLTPPSLSAPTESEPNDTSREASLIEIDEELRAVHAALSSQRDVDIFRVQAPPETILIVRAIPKDPQLDLKLSVFADTSPPQLYDAQKAGKEELARHVSTRVSPLFLKVESVAGQGAYELDFQVRLTDGALETEPNDDPSVALPLPIPGALQGYIDRVGDRDIYLLEPTPHMHVVSLRLTPPRQLTQTVSVFATPTAPEPILVLTSPPNGSLFLPNLRAQGSQLFLHVTAAAGQFSEDLPYTLEASLLPPLPPEQTFETEPNDTSATAQQILGTTVKGYFHHPNDADWFTWNPAASILPEFPQAGGASPEFPALLEKPRPTHLYEVMARSLRPGLGLELVWNLAQGLQRVGAKAGETLSWCPVTQANEPLPPFGILPVAIEPGIPTGFDYELVVRNVLDSTHSFEVEPNGTPAQADRLLPNLPHQGRLFEKDDVDTWAFDWVPQEGNPGQLIRFSVANHPADLQMSLLDAQGLPVAQANEAGQGGAEEVSLSLPQGRYFVVIKSSTSGHCEPYRLMVAVQ